MCSSDLSSPDEQEVLIAATRKEKVEDRVAVAQLAGLKPLVIDVESFAQQSALGLVVAQLPNQGKDMNIAIVDVGANAMNVTVLRNEQAVYSREQAFGGNQLTQDISRTFGLSFDEAELKKRSMDLPENYTRDVLQPFIENVALEVTRALQFFFTSTPYGRVDQIMLAGGCAARHIDEYKPKQRTYELPVAVAPGDTSWTSANAAAVSPETCNRICPWPATRSASSAAVRHAASRPSTSTATRSARRSTSSS